MYIYLAHTHSRAFVPANMRTCVLDTYPPRKHVCECACGVYVLFCSYFSCCCGAHLLCATTWQVCAAGTGCDVCVYFNVGEQCMCVSCPHRRPASLVGCTLGARTRSIRMHLIFRLRFWRATFTYERMIFLCVVARMHACMHRAAKNPAHISEQRVRDAWWTCAKGQTLCIRALVCSPLSLTAAATAAEIIQLNLHAHIASVCIYLCICYTHHCAVASEPSARKCNNSYVA